MILQCREVRAWAPEMCANFRLRTLAFAQRFVDWNTIDHGIQRVDACRAPDGELLLVELEDLNPFLSLELTDDATRTRFVARMAQSLTGLLAL